MIVEMRPAECLRIRSVDDGRNAPSHAGVQIRFCVDGLDLPTGMLLDPGCQPLKACLAVWVHDDQRWRWATPGPILLDAIIRFHGAGSVQTGAWYDGMIAPKEVSR